MLPNSDMENYLNSSFGGYPYNGGGASLTAGTHIGNRMSPLAKIGPKPAVSAAPAKPPVNLGRTSSGPMPYQLMQASGANGVGAGMNFGSMGTSAAPTAENAANNITRANVSQPNAALARAQAPIAPPAPAPAAPKLPTSTLGGGFERSQTPLNKIGVQTGLQSLARRML